MSRPQDRAALAFGEQTQITLDALRVAFVGVGGLGSEVATMLRRVSSAHLLLIDADAVEESNLPRLPGTCPTDVGQPKAEVVSRLLDRGSLAPAAARCLMVEDIDDRELFTSDIVVVTADGAGPRAEVAIRARRYGFGGLVVFAAARIDPPATHTSPPRLLGRVSVQGPRSGWCVICGGIVDPSDAARDLDVGPDTREAAGYGAAATVASVAWWNSVIAGRAVQVIHEHAAGHRPELASRGLDWYLDGHELLVVDHDDAEVTSCALCVRTPPQQPVQGLPPLTSGTVISDQGSDEYGRTR